MGHGTYREPPQAQLRLEAGEKRTLDLVILPGEGGDKTLSVDLAGEGAEVCVRGLLVCTGTDKAHFRAVIHHRAPGCTSSLEVRCIAGGGAQCQLDSVAIVAPGAQRTQAVQQLRSLLVGTEARVQGAPQLEIYADDVQCSHGLAIGKPDEAALHYLRSRGIPEREALLLLMHSFLSPVLPSGREGEVEAALRDVLVF